jgi:hypothetical protein
MRYALLLFVATWSAAQEDHSQHAHAGARLGRVDFRTSCSSRAQEQVSRGVALLHSFGYEEARLTFREALAADPACAIAEWGVARSWYHPIWAPPSPAELKEGAAAVERARAIGAKTAREREYIEALAVFYRDWEKVDHGTRARGYEQALGRLSERYPDDDEAAIFHALQLVAIGYLDPTDHTYAWQRKGIDILNRMLPRHPDHPGVAHYIIHSVDYPSLAELGLKAARAYAGIAPDSSHAQHMPSHIFTRLGLWDESIASNRAAERSAIAQAQRLHGGGGAFDQLHAIDYLVYAYLQQAKDRSARQVLDEMAALTKLDEMAALTKLDENQFAAAYAFAAAPARWALERHDWKAAASLELTPAWFPWDRFRNVEALVHYTRAIGAARAGDAAAARQSAIRIAKIGEALPATRDYDWSGSIRALFDAAVALSVYAEGRKAEGLRLLRAAADHEDAVDKHPVTPGVVLPMREMLADLLREGGSAAEALREYEAVLKVAPRRFHATAGAARAAEAAGDRVKARAYADGLLEIAKGAEEDRPELGWAHAYVGR